MAESYEEKMKTLLLEEQKYKNSNYALGLGQTSMQMNKDDAGLIKEQLSLGEELETIDYLLRSYSLEYNPQTKRNEWKKPDNEDFIIFSDYGVHLFRQIISAYLNKNTLLSNYEDKVIQTKMYDLSTEINDLILLSYEKIFLMPTIERCKQEIENDVSERLEIRTIACEFAGLEVDKSQERERIIKTIEYQLEKKIAEVRQRIFKQKLNRFSLILRFIQDIIHSTYNRAEGGQERASLRKHMQVSEVSGANPMPQNNKRGLLDRMGFK